MFIKKIRKVMRRSKFLFNLRAKIIHNHQRKKLHTVGYEALDMLNKVCESLDMDICCAYGTLLGFVRENKFIEYDDDIDMMVVNDNRFSWDLLEEKLEEYGFKRVRYFTYKKIIMQQTYEWKGITIDFFMFTPTDKGMIAYFFDRKYGVDYENDKQFSTKKASFPKLTGVERKIFNGRILYIPKESEKWLEYWYGSSWKIPDPNFRPPKKSINWMEEYGYVHI